MERYINICIYVHVVYLYVSLHACMVIFMNLFIHVYSKYVVFNICIYPYVHVCMYAFEYVCTYAMYVSMYFILADAGKYVYIYNIYKFFKLKSTDLCTVCIFICVHSCLNVYLYAQNYDICTVCKCNI